MKKKRIILWLYLLTSVVYAQHNATSFSVNNSPQSTQTPSPSLCDTSISYFNSYLANSISTSGHTTWKAAIFIDSVELQPITNPRFEAINFYIDDLSVLSAVHLEIYENSMVSYTSFASLSLGNLIYSKDVSGSITPYSFNTHLLDSIITADKTKGYTIVVIFEPTNSYDVFFGTGTPTPDKGAWMSTGNNNPFSSISSIGNFPIKVCLRRYNHPDHDVKLNDALFTPTGYHTTPINQLDTNGYHFWVDIKNIGDTVENPTAKINVNAGQFVDSVVIPNLGINNIKRGTIPTPYLPHTTGNYLVKATASIDSTDSNPLDNLRNNTFIISDSNSLYARTVGSNYSSSGNYRGNVYEIHNETWVKHVKVHHSNILNPNQNNVAQIWKMNPDSTVGSLLYTSDTVKFDSYISTSNLSYHYLFNNTLVKLAPGKYLVSVGNSTGIIGNSVNYYEPKTSFYSNLGSSNWIETPNVYFRIDLQLSDCPNTTIITNIKSGYCISDSLITLSALPTGGSFSGNGVTDSLFNLTIAGIDTHMIVYDYNYKGCISSDTVFIKVDTATRSTILNTDTVFCQSEAPVLLSAIPVGGRFKGTGMNEDTFDPSITAGTYPIVYQYNPACPSFDTINLTVLHESQISISGLNPIHCTAESNIHFTTTPTGVIASGTGISGNTFSPSNAGEGQHTIYFSYNNPNGCISQDSLTLEVRNTLSSLDFTPSIDGNELSITNNSTNHYSWVWIFDDGHTSNQKDPVHYYEWGGVYNVCLLAFDVCKNLNKICMDVTIATPPNSVNELLEQAISVYPNPTNRDLNIEVTTSGEYTLSYDLLDITGRAILTESTYLKDKEKILLDLSSVEKGTYFLRLVMDGNTTTKKIVVE